MKPDLSKKSAPKNHVILEISLKEHASCVSEVILLLKSASTVKKNT